MVVLRNASIHAWCAKTWNPTIPAAIEKTANSRTIAPCRTIRRRNGRSGSSGAPRCSYLKRATPVSISLGCKETIEHRHLGAAQPTQYRIHHDRIVAVSLQDRNRGRLSRAWRQSANGSRQLLVDGPVRIIEPFHDRRLYRMVGLAKPPL